MDKPSEEQRITKPNGKALGIDPGVAQYTKVWSERTADLKKELATILLATPGLHGYVLPWDRIGCATIGNSCKALYIQLLIHHLKKVVELKFSDLSCALGGNCNVSLSEDFLGIKHVIILQPALFDNPGSYIHTVRWAKMNPDHSKAKTVQKLWHTAGLREPVDACAMIYTFEAELRFKHLTSTRNANSKRSASSDLSTLPNKKQHADGALHSDTLAMLNRNAAIVLQQIKARSEDPASAIPLDRVETLELRAENAELRLKAAEFRIAAADCRANAAEMMIKVVALRAEAVRLEEQAAAIAPK